MKERVRDKKGEREYGIMVFQTTWYRSGFETGRQILKHWNLNQPTGESSKTDFEKSDKVVF